MHPSWNEWIALILSGMGNAEILLTAPLLIYPRTSPKVYISNLTTETTNKPKEEKEARSDNRLWTQWRVRWLIEHSTLHQLLWCIGSFVLRIENQRS